MELVASLTLNRGALQDLAEIHYDSLPTRYYLVNYSSGYKNLDLQPYANSLRKSLSGKHELYHHENKTVARHTSSAT